MSDKTEPQSPSTKPVPEDSIPSAVTGLASDNTQVNSLDDAAICRYLMLHPNFFIRHAQQLTNVQIPHPIRGAVSLPEWHMARQRQHIALLEQTLQQQVEQAADNEALFDALFDLHLALLQAADLPDLVHRLNQWARRLGLQGAYVYLFADKWQLAVPSRFQHLALDVEKFDFIRIRHLQFSHTYLGQLNPVEAALIFPQLDYVGSVALSLLGEFGDLGIVAFASRDPNHYQPGQGVMLLEKIRLLLPHLLNRFLARA